MAKSSPPVANAYPPELRAKAVWMVNNGWAPSEVRDLLGPSTASIGNWRNAPHKLPAFTPDPVLLLEAQGRGGDGGAAQTNGNNGGNTETVSEATETPGNELVPASNGTATLPAAPPEYVRAELVKVSDLVEAKERAAAAEAAQALIAELRAAAQRSGKEHEAALVVAAEATEAEKRRADILASAIGVLAPR